ncbi:MAG: methanol dehydrogenase [Glaciimonas sp.]|nr:methanol dehydrogenase [Glaciimonas sp.]
MTMRIVILAVICLSLASCKPKEKESSAPEKIASTEKAVKLIKTATEVPSTAEKLYTVVDGDKVDNNTLNGWRTWRALACERCHGAQQEGLVGPSLVNSLKVLSKDDFKKTVLNGRMEKGMPNFGGSKQVIDNIDYLYAYLKGRSDGNIKPGRLQAIEQ